jgi:Domain of unknown function (DUF4296)
MVQKISIILFCVLLINCTPDKTVTIPDTVLSKEKMAAVMVDIHLLEASMNVTGMNPKRIDLAGSSMVLNIDLLKKHNITKQQFQDSFAFYSIHPALLSEVYQLVLNDLSKMQAEAQKTMPGAPKGK